MSKNYVAKKTLLDGKNLYPNLVIGRKRMFDHVMPIPDRFVDEIEDGNWSTEFEEELRVFLSHFLAGVSKEFDVSKRTWFDFDIKPYPDGSEFKYGLVMGIVGSFPVVKEKVAVATKA